MLSDGRSRRPGWPLFLFLTGVVWFAVLGAYVFVRAMIGLFT